MDLFRQLLRGAGGEGGGDDRDGENDQLLLYEDYTSSEEEGQSEDEEGEPVEISIHLSAIPVFQLRTQFIQRMKRLLDRKGTRKKARMTSPFLLVI